MAAPTRAHRRHRRAVRRRAAVAAALVLAALALRMAVAQPYVVPTASMAPAIAGGDVVLGARLAASGGPVRRGDVVVFDGAGTLDATTRHVRYVKRVAARGGDTVACCDGAGRTVVNGQATGPSDPQRVPFGPLLVPAGHVFVLGDNRAHSLDSRYRGPVPISAIEARAVAVVWPPNHLRVLTR